MVLRGVLGFDRIYPAHESVIHRQKLRFTYDRLSYPHLRPTAPNHTILNHHFQKLKSTLKEQFSNDRQKNVMLCYRISNYVHILLPFHSSPAHPPPATPFPRQPHPNYQTFKKKKKENSINARLKILVKERCIKKKKKKKPHYQPNQTRPPIPKYPQKKRRANANLYK